MLTLTTTLISSTLYVIIRRDPDYTNIATHLRTVLRRRISRFKGFDWEEYQRVKREVEAREVWVRRVDRVV